MKLIYVAGKYNGKDPIEIKENILKAERVALECWRKGWAVICPHKNTGGFEIYEGEQFISWNTWMDGDLEMVGRCDAIVMVDNWVFSQGARMELNHAQQLKKEVFMSVDDVEKLNKIKYIANLEDKEE